MNHSSSRLAIARSDCLPKQPPHPSGFAAHLLPRGEKGPHSHPLPYLLALLDPEQCLLAPARGANSTLRPNLTQPYALLPKPPRGRSLTALIHRAARDRTQRRHPQKWEFRTIWTAILGSTEDSQISPAIGEFIRRNKAS